MTVAAHIEIEKCGKCEKTVYEAEGFPADGKRFHKKCFKCFTCARKLDSTTVRTHQGQLYCKLCQKKTFPDESPKIYTDTTTIAPKDEKGCPRCGGAVYEAEKVTVKDEFYHKRCFTCNKCSRSLDTFGAYVAQPENNIYCKVCFKQVTAHDRPQVPTDMTLIPADEEGQGCPRCGGKVFEAEKMTAKTGLYHRKCFTCFNCKRALDYQLCSEGPDSELYCKLCYSHKHGHKSKANLNTADVAAIQGDEGDADACPRCHGRVFEAEKQVTKNAVYHKKCFTCIKCKHQMDASNFTNGPDDVYCLYCYRVTHGHKAMTRSMPLDTTSIIGDQGDKRRCPRCSGKVFEAEKMVAASGWYHRHCFRCSFCSQPVDSTSVCDGPDNKIFCRVCYGRIRGSSKPRFLDGANVDTYSIQAGAEDNPCPRCNGKVFEAEKITSVRHVYHKKCFTCKECLRPMDQFISCDAPDGEVVCRPCYDKKYSCKMQPLSGADMLKLLDTSIIKGGEEDKDTCPRCSGKVYHAEKITVKGRTYHLRCASCRTCTKPLSSKDLCDGKDSDIYCKSCYARKYGAPGYRGAGCGDWTDADSAETLRPVQDIDVSKIKGIEGDPDTCPRCKGKIFETERKVSKNHHWHKKCFNCFKCHTVLDGSLKYTFDAPDDEIYCKVCFKKTFPEAEMPLIYLDTTLLKPSGEDGGCPRCGGAVFQAEEMNIKGRVYHKKCLSCKNCKRPIDISILAIGQDEDIYCKICCDKISAPHQYQGASDTTVIAGEENSCCPRCNGKVFEAEKMLTKKAMYHKKCFACIACKSSLDYYSAIEGPDDEVYCRVCYLRAYGPGGKNKYGDKTFFEAGDTDPDACIRCHGKVFEAEKIVAKAGLIHKYCLECRDCKCNLDASSFFNGGDGDIYCRHCYAKKFGHRMKSEYKGWMDVKQIQGSHGDKSTCPRCSGKVFEAERMVTRVGDFHRNCFSCIQCNKKLDSTSCCEGPDREIYCENCYSLDFGTKSRSMPRRANSFKRARARSVNVPKYFNTQDDMLARSTIETWVIKAEAGDQDCCPKCTGRVFEAEKMVTASGMWYHKNCFRCVECERQLDSLTNNDGADGRLYCKMCYNKQYGPQTRALDIDLHVADTASIKSADEKKNCPRCGGAVFKAEEIYSHGKSYHKKCANCAGCAKQLDFSTIYDGEDKDIYCRACYSRKFAPAGYRGTGCSEWVDAEASGTLRHSYQAF